MSDSVLTKAEITELRDLARSSSLRNEEGLVVVEGFRAISGALAASGICQRLIVSSRAEAERSFPEVEMTFVDQKVIDKIATTTSAQGAIGIFHMPRVEVSDITEISSPIFVLDHVSDPGNMGTIFRSCAAFSIHGIVTIGGCDPFHPKVVRSSAGTIFGVTIYPAHDYELGSLLADRKIFAANAHAETSVSDLGRSDASAYVFGSEAHGIQTDFFTNNAEHFTIRMAELCESLNVAMTATIVAHQLSRS